MYLKRHKAPKHWPIKRKGTTYVVRANSNLKQGIPILIILRDLLKVAENRKEVKKIIHRKFLLLNNRLVKNEKNSATLFDVITLIPSKESYRLELSTKGIFELKKIQEKEAIHKISKITNKKILRGKKVQLNLSDGRNYLSDIKCKVNDSVIINFKNEKIEKCLSLAEKKEVIVFAGKHAGKIGVIKKMQAGEKMVEIERSEEKINVLIKQIMVTK